MEDNQIARHTWVWVAGVLYLFLLVRTAWVSDDAYITARVIENAVHGYGPVYNVGERVQVYTHPLWFLLLSILYGALVHLGHMDFRAQMYFFLVGVSIVTSMAAMVVLLRYTLRSEHSWLLGISALLFSRSFIDFSTSGLEYPLIYLLLAIFGWRWYAARGSRRMAELSFWFALLLTTRTDLAPLLVPVWVWELFRSPLPWRQRLRQSALGWLPFLLWEGFSLVYYGFPFPNTYYAKLGGTGISWRFRLHQGLIYVLHTWDADPVTVFVILFVSLYALYAIRQGVPERARLFAAVFGLGLYMLYVLYAGGDFMRGRFLVPALFWAVIVWDWLPWPDAYRWPMVGVLALLGFSAWYPVFKPQGLLMVPDGVREKVWNINPQGIADERLYYMFHPEVGGRALIQWRRQRYPKPPFPDSPYRGRAWVYDPSQRTVRLVSTTGVQGYAAGPSTHIVDVFALVDPLLARLPAVDRELARTGHVFRNVPAGYLPALEQGDPDLIQDPHVRAYYRWLSRVVHGPLFRRERWEAIWKLNTGQIRPPETYHEASEDEIKRYWAP